MATRRRNSQHKPGFLARLRQKAPLAPHPATEAFLTHFHLLATPCCLCNGLEVIASNAAFSAMIHQSGRRPRNVLLNRLFADQQAVERLVSTPGMSVSLPLTDAAGASSLLMATHHRITALEPFALIEWRDDTNLRVLTDALSQSRRIDAQSGAFRAGVFMEEVDNALASGIGNAILVQIGINQPLCSSRGSFDLTTRSAMMAALHQLLRADFGADAIIGRTDAQQMSVLIPLGNDEEAASDSDCHHLLLQIDRLTRGLLRRIDPAARVSVCAARAPADADTAEALAACASLAALPEGTRLYDRDLKEKAERARAIRLAFPKALRSGEIEPHFQPVIRARDNSLVGFEALVRWQHPSLGRIIPPEILDAAEQCNLMAALNAHVLRMAVAEAVNWPDNVHMAVNISPREFNHRLIEQVRTVLTESGIEPSRLEVEVTEEALFEDFDASAAVLARLRALGVGVAMDDFGAGYTSVSSLGRLPFSRIKIDRSITNGLPRDPRTLAIIRAMLGLAAELSIDITIEGVEDEDQLHVLRTHDCDVQGFVFAPALPREQLMGLRPFLSPSGPPARKDRGAIVPIGSRTRPSRAPIIAG